MNAAAGTITSIAAEATDVQQRQAACSQKGEKFYNSLNNLKCPLTLLSQVLIPIKLPLFPTSLDPI